MSPAKVTARTDMTQPHAHRPRTTLFRDGFPIRDRWSQLIVVTILLAPAIALAVAFDWPTASATSVMLRQAYPGRQVRIATFKTTTLDTACGFFALNGDRYELRYLKSETGLVAERTVNQWQVFASNRPYQDRWESCMTASGRGHTFDFVADPIVVALLGYVR